jgi:hypothetical protein
MKRLAPLLLVSALAASQPACYGSYGAFKAVNRWNGHITGSKIGNSVIHFLFWIPLPVYPLAILGDFFIFNTVEFATGNRVFR